MVTPYKHAKTGMFWIRKGIPEKLRPKFGGKREFVESLRTKNAAEAKAKAVLWLADVERKLAEAKDGLPSLKPKDLPRIGEFWLATALKLDEDERQANYGTAEDKNAEANAKGKSIYDVELEQLNSVSNMEELEAWTLSDAIETLGKLRIAMPDKEEKQYLHLLNTIRNAKFKYYEILTQRYHGTWVDGPKLEELSVVDGLHKETLLDMHSLWAKQDKPRLKTVDEYRTTVIEFYNVIGTKPVQSVKPEHVRRYKEYLEEKELRGGTISKKVGVIKTLMNTAITNGYIERNPAVGFKINKSEGKIDRLPFTSEDIDAIFSSPVFTQKKRPRGGAGEAAYWIPLLAYYTGARLEELGQLLKEDIQELNETPFIEILNIDDENGRKKVKTDAGKRIIPIHPDLVRLGFLKYVSKQKKNGRIFPEFTPNKYGKLTHNWSKWWARYLDDKVGIDEEGKVFHSFRHTLYQLWNESGAAVDYQVAMIGHADKGDVRYIYSGWQNPVTRHKHFASPDKFMEQLLKLKFTAKL